MESRRSKALHSKLATLWERPSYVWSAPSCLSRTMNGRFSDATWPWKLSALSAILQPLACPPWQPDHAANAAQEPRSYTTRWGTIHGSLRSMPEAYESHLMPAPEVPIPDSVETLPSNMFRAALGGAREVGVCPGLDRGSEPRRSVPAYPARGHQGRRHEDDRQFVLRRGDPLHHRCRLLRSEDPWQACGLRCGCIVRGDHADLQRRG